MVLAEVFLGAFLPLLLDRLTPGEILGYFGSLGGVGKKLQKWKETLIAIAAVLSDAEEKQLTSEPVKLWLNDLKHLAYDIDDLLNTFSNEMSTRKQLKVNQTGTRKVRGFFTKVPHKVKFNYTMNSEIDEIANRLQNISDRKEKLGLRYIEHTSSSTSTSSSQRPPSSPVLDGPVIGRDEDKRKIVELLFTDVVPSSTNKYQVVSIVGMGGLGKSTLAAQVYNDVATMEQFDLKIWVSVSDDFNLEKVTRAICQKVTSCDGGVSMSDDSNLEKMNRTIYQRVTSPPCDMVEFSQLQENLSKEINGKRFLIVLDDVWSTCDYDSWTKLQAPFRGGAEGSKVMVTTREEKVAALMGAAAAAVYYLKTLSDESCLQLFEQHVNSDRPPNFKLLKKKIIRNCKGLPLAAKALGGVLRCAETDKWEDILNDELWSISDESNILPVLRLSYHHLPSPLKRCFAYCSILPNDYEFGKIQLILLWMAEGFLDQPQGSRAMEDIGEEYFKELLSRSFFQKSGKDDSKLLSRSFIQKSGKDDSKYVMHDLFGDLARWAAGDTFARLENKLLAGCSPNTRHLAYIPGKFDGRQRFESVSNAKHLRTFLPLPASDGSVGHSQEDVLDQFLSHIVRLNHPTPFATSEILPKLKYLRVLSLRGYKLTEVAKSIGELRHLRYLNLSLTFIVSLPKSTCTLYNLQTLMLDNCSKLKTLPSNLSSLSNLRHLHNFNTPSLEEMPPQVGQLTHLRTLDNFVVGEGNSVSGIGEIGSLNLRGSLSIGRLENVTDVGDPKRAQLMTKEGLHTLELEWSGTSEIESEVLCSLEPHKKVLELTIKGYHGLEFSQWIGNPSFSVMTCVKLDNCKNCRVLPPLGKLPCLKTLQIVGLAGVESVGAEFYGKDCLPFPALKTLEIMDMPVWKKWLPCKRDEEVQVFPCLRKFHISGCPKLESIVKTFHVDNCLEVLEIVWCENLISLPEGLCHLSILRSLSIKYCGSLISLPTGGLPSNLTDLHIRGCHKLEALPRGMDKLTSLQALRLSSGDLSSILEEGFPPNLIRLSIAIDESCKPLSEWGLHQLDRLASLKELWIRDSHGDLVSFPPKELLLPKSLTELIITDFPNLRCLSSSFQSLTSLESLSIRDCPKLESVIPEQADHLPLSLTELGILGGCPLLEKRYQHGKGTHRSEIANIPYIHV